MTFSEFMEINEFCRLCETIGDNLFKPKKMIPRKPIDPTDAKLQLKQIMGTSKAKHSIRVGQTLKDIGVPLDAVHAAYYHDYAERGGNLHDIVDRLGLSPTVKTLIHMLTDNDDGDVLKHVQSSFASVDEGVRNLAILIKISDRLDNLKIRLRAEQLTSKYLKKSRKLLNWLFTAYTGESHLIQPLRNQLFDLGVQLGKLSTRSF